MALRAVESSPSYDFSSAELFEQVIAKFSRLFFPVCQRTSIFLLNQVSRPYFRLYGHESSELDSGSTLNMFGPVLDGTGQIVLADQQ